MKTEPLIIPEGVVAVKVWLFWTDDHSLFSALIRQVAGAPSHMGIGFSLSDGTDVYYEALFSNGFTGPWPKRALIDWREEDKRRRLVVMDTWINPTWSEKIHQNAQEMRGRVSYGKVQILWNWFFERIGQHAWIRIPKTCGKVTCSESASTLIGPQIDLRTRQRKHFDEITPNHALLQFLSLWRLHKEFDADFEDILQRYTQ